MIDRSQLHFCLRPFWFLTAGGFAAVLILMDLFSDLDLEFWPWLALLLALGVPGFVLLMVCALRGEGQWKYYFHKIGYTCPKCSHHTVPHFRCPMCSRLLQDLRPSFYGVFHVHCVCGARLPTLDWNGRLELAKVCPNCSADLLHEDFGSEPEYRIAVVGATSSGKSNLMIAALWQLEQHFAPANQIDISFGSPADEAVYRQHVEWLEKGLVMQKTLTLPIPRAFTISLVSPNGQGCLLYLYDAAGEDYQEEQRLANHPLEKYDGILFVVDPFAEEGMQRGALGILDPAEVQQTNPAQIEASEILGRLINVLEPVLKVPVGGVFPLPFAVVVTKVDACGLSKRLRLGADRMGGPHFSLAAAAHSAERFSPRVRTLFTELGLGNLISIIEARFALVRYFPVSALGRSINPSDRSAFKPVGPLGPLVWLCYHTDALSEADSFNRIFINFNLALLRSLRGFEGTRDFMMAWGFLACIAFLIFIAIQLLPPLLLFVGGGIQAIAVFILYGCLFYELVHRRFRK
jgi:hypothetical protein